MKKVCSTLGIIFTFFALLILTLSATLVPRVNGAEQSSWEESITGTEEFTFEPPQVQLSEDNTIKATFLIDSRWFKFRLVYNKTTVTYSIYSIGELIIGESCLEDEGELVAENMQGPAVSTDGTYDPREINYWFRIETIDNVTILYYDGVKVLTVFSENSPSEVIKVLSPENKTYTSPDVPLEYVTNQIFCTVTYSLDGGANQTIYGNIVLGGLTEGTHSVVMYVVGSPENITASKTIYFTISFVNDETKFLAPQTESDTKTDSTSTNSKTETPDCCTEETKATDIKALNENNLNEIPPQTPQNTNTPNKSTSVFTGFVPFSFFIASVGTSDLSAVYVLIGILVMAISWFFAEANLKKFGR